MPVDSRANASRCVAPTACCSGRSTSTGEPFEIEAHGWLARIFQHEYDHLDGVLYADRLEHPFSKAAAKAVRKNGWGVPRPHLDAGASTTPRAEVYIEGQNLC